jgi:hypothetical protein
MRVIIAGSRHVHDQGAVDRAMRHFEHAHRMLTTVVLSGCASGVDALGEDWAKRHGVPVERYAALWDVYGKSAGPRRNADMVSRADALVALPCSCSRGTQDTILKARNAWLRVLVVQVDCGKR